VLYFLFIFFFLDWIKYCLHHLAAIVVTGPNAWHNVDWIEKNDQASGEVGFFFIV
jgi:hypothetical protein